MKRINIKLYKNVIIFVLVFAAALVLFDAPVEARTKSGKCIYKDCGNFCYGNSVYCKNHDPSYKLSHTKCYEKGCNSYTASGCGSYCSYHYNKKFGNKKTYSGSKSSSTSKNSSSYSTKSKKKSIDNYDEGYEAVWLDDDYDWNRYQKDSTYAAGVDDAMDDLDDDW